MTYKNTSSCLAVDRLPDTGWDCPQILEILGQRECSGYADLLAGRGLSRSPLEAH